MPSAKPEVPNVQTIVGRCSPLSFFGRDGRRADAGPVQELPLSVRPALHGAGRRTIVRSRRRLVSGHHELPAWADGRFRPARRYDHAHARAPAPPGAALLAFLGPTRSQYDTKACNRHFGDSFPIPECLRCEYCGGKVEIHLKPCGGDNPSNDNYTIGTARSEPANTIASGRIWPSGTPAETTLVVDLPASRLNALLCKRGAGRTLDVYIEDDTIVDWVRVTLYSH